MVGIRKKTRKPKTDNRLATKQYVNRQIHLNTENKYYLHYPSTEYASIGNTWVEHNLCEPTQGDGISNRTGNSITVTAVQWRMVIQAGADELATDDAFNVVRIIFGRYGGASNTPITTGGAGINEVLNREIGMSGNLIKKYYDKYIPLMITSTEKGAGDGYTPQIKVLNYYKRFKKPIKIVYGDNGVTLPTSRFILSMISDSAAVTHPGIINGFIVVTYEDA